MSSGEASSSGGGSRGAPQPATRNTGMELWQQLVENLLRRDAAETQWVRIVAKRLRRWTFRSIDEYLEYWVEGRCTPLCPRADAVPIPRMVVVAEFSVDVNGNGTTAHP